MSDTKTIPQISVDSETIFRRLQKMEVGDTVTYKELSDLIRRNVQHEGAGNLSTARKKALSECQMVFGCVRGIGLKRLNGSESLDATQSYVGRSRSAARKARRIAATIEMDDLDAQDRTRYERVTTTAAVLELVTKPSKQKKLEDKISENGKAGQVTDVLKLFGA